MRRYPDPEYFEFLTLLDLLRAGKVPPGLDVAVAERHLLSFMQQALGEN